MSTELLRVSGFAGVGTHIEFGGNMYVPVVVKFGAGLCGEASNPTHIQLLCRLDLELVRKK